MNCARDCQPDMADAPLTFNEAMRNLKVEIACLFDAILGRNSQLDRIEAKLDALLEALADEAEEMERPELTLDGVEVGGERDDSQPL